MPTKKILSAIVCAGFLTVVSGCGKDDPVAAAKASIQPEFSSSVTFEQAFTPYKDCETGTGQWTTEKNGGKGETVLFTCRIANTAQETLGYRTEIAKYAAYGELLEFTQIFDRLLGVPTFDIPPGEVDKNINEALRDLQAQDETGTAVSKKKNKLLSEIFSSALIKSARLEVRFVKDAEKKKQYKTESAGIRFFWKDGYALWNADPASSLVQRVFSQEPALSASPFFGRNEKGQVNADEFVELYMNRTVDQAAADKENPNETAAAPSPAASAKDSAEAGSPAASSPAASAKKDDSGFTRL